MGGAGKTDSLCIAAEVILRPGESWETDTDPGPGRKRSGVLPVFSP
jgi:hypothetical protein